MVPSLQIVTAIPLLATRDLNMHKGDAGKIFCLAGSVGMVGAAALCSRAALRAGAGLVRVGMPWRLAAIVAGRDPNVMTFALPETDDGSVSAMAPAKILKAVADYDTILLGPGISTNPQTMQAVRVLLPQLKHKLVIDADALNAIAKDPAEALESIDRSKGLPILTPHPGEMKRLVGEEYADVDLQFSEKPRRELALYFARKFKVVLVLKGRGTIVTDGERIYTNKTGNPGMAKAGSGDVLAGVIAALRGQGFSDFDAAVLGVYLQGLAGDIAAREKGEISMIATDIIEALPEATRTHQENPAGQ